LHNTASVYQKAVRSIFSSSNKENLDQISQIKDTTATVCRAAPIFDSYPDSDDDSQFYPDDHLNLVITLTPQ